MNSRKLQDEDDEIVPRPIQSTRKTRSKKRNRSGDGKAVSAPSVPVDKKQKSQKENPSKNALNWRRRSRRMNGRTQEFEKEYETLRMNVPDASNIQGEKQIKDLFCKVQRQHQNLLENITNEAKHLEALVVKELPSEPEMMGEVRESDEGEKNPDVDKLEIFIKDIEASCVTLSSMLERLKDFFNEITGKDIIVEIGSGPRHKKRKLSKEIEKNKTSEMKHMRESLAGRSSFMTEKEKEIEKAARELEEANETLAENRLRLDELMEGNSMSLKVSDNYDQTARALRIAAEEMGNAWENIESKRMIDRESSIIARLRNRRTEKSLRDLFNNLPSNLDGSIQIPSNNKLCQTDCFLDGANIAYHRYGKNNPGFRSRNDGWEFEDVMIAMAHLFKLNYRAVIVLSDMARMRGTTHDKKRMDDLEERGFLVWTPPNSGDDMALLQLAYMANAYIVSNDKYSLEITSQIGDSKERLQTFIQNRRVGFDFDRTDLQLFSSILSQPKKDTDDWMPLTLD